MQSRYLTIAGREIHYMEWGRADAPALVMVHGLARTGRDFDDLAAALADRYRIIVPDMIGRGLSQWSPAPAEEYCLAAYDRLMTGLVDALGIARLRWVGTSMGGAIGIHAAAGSLRGRISHLVLNDIGPQIAGAAIDRIRAYAGSPPQFDTVGELEAYFRTVYRPYGHLTDAQWRRLTETSTRRTDAGKVTPHYDPRMVMQFETRPGDYDQWPAYDRVTARTLTLRGRDSDLLLPDVAAEMTARGPKSRLAVIDGCGHAPALNLPEHFTLVADFLAQ